MISASRFCAVTESGRVIEGCMSNIFHPYEPDQSLLFPASPREWLPEDHLVWFISDTIDELDIEALVSKYRPGGKGNLAYHPRMMLKLLIYGYCTGVFSSRKLARQLHENVAFRVLAAGQFPNHRTICRFRERHLAEFESLFVQVVQIAQQAGLAKMGTIAVDGSKVKANASKHKAMSYERMQQEEKRLRREIRDLTKKARTQDAADDEKYGPDFRGDELPEEISRRSSRLKVIQEAKKRLEERKRAEAEDPSKRDESSEKKGKKGQGSRKPGRPRVHPVGKPRPKDQENFTDPDSRIMKASTGGFEPCYNAEIAVDSHGQIVVGTSVTQSAADTNELLPLIEQSAVNTSEMPHRVLADAGYRSEANFAALEQREIKGFIPLGREGKTIPRTQRDTATGRMAQRMRGKRGRKTYKQRKHIVEPVFGWIKQVLGFRSYSLRGLSKVSAEWNLVCLALNLRRMSEFLAWK
jgi:transposase